MNTATDAREIMMGDGRGQQTASPMFTTIMSGGVGISGRELSTWGQGSLVKVSMGTGLTWKSQHNYTCNSVAHSHHNLPVFYNKLAELKSSFIPYPAKYIST